MENPTTILSQADGALPAKRREVRVPFQITTVRNNVMPMVGDKDFTDISQQKNCPNTIAKVLGDTCLDLEEVASIPEPSKPGVAVPIAICGIALRLPGGVRDTEAFWDVLHKGQDMRGEIPQSRFNPKGFDKSLGLKGAFDIQHGYFLEDDLACLDASLFTVGKTELEKLDPKQRQMLEVTRECLENAGETGYRGKNIGCYMGTFGDDWDLIQSKESLQSTGGYKMGLDLFLANRISYEYNLRGPSMLIKTGCSASLVALHEACRALQFGDCDAALVGGASIILTPSHHSIMAAEGILSPDGSCKPFDAAANGFARGEAVNAVFVKRLDDAVRDGNPIRGIVRSTGNNANGRGRGLMSPDAAAQETLIRNVYASAGLNPSDTAYIECHGTGTPVGDRVEAAAVGSVFGEEGIYIGSVKANVGHSEGASGLTSLIKAVLSLEKQIIPPQIKFDTPNPKIKFAEDKLKVARQAIPWPEHRAERISINSFGIGGSNVHVIVDSLASFRPDLVPRDRAVQMASIPRILPLSASSSLALKQMGDRILDYVRKHPERLGDLSYTLSQHRETLSQRSFLILGGGNGGSLAPIIKTPALPPKIVMVFAGQGAQWARMGSQLILGDAEFRADIATMNSVLHGLSNPPSWSLEEELLRDTETSRVYQAEISQPLSTAIQIAVANSLSRKGIRPDAVVGHSSGELAAAYAAGSLSLAAAITISYYRGFVMKHNPKIGSMAALGLGVAEVAPYLVDGVVVAAENSPKSTTISGDSAAVEQVIAAIKKRYPSSFARILQVDKAYHSHHMVPLAEPYLERIQEVSLEPQAPRIPMYSTVYGRILDEPLSLSYWAINLKSPVKFAPAVSALYRDLPGSIMLELGPHSQLMGPLRQIAAEDKVQVQYIPAMVRNHNCTERLLTAVGGLWGLGVEVDFASWIHGRVLTDLPAYPWDHSTRYWYESRASKAWRHRKYGHHALLGQRIPEGSDLEPTWRVLLDLEDEPWLVDHKVRQDIVFPFAGYVSMAGEAIRQLTGVNTGYSIKHIIAHSAMLLQQGKPVEILTSLRRHKITDSTESEYYHFTIASFTGSSWIKHCDGLVRANDIVPASQHEIATLPRKASAQRLYTSFSRVGTNFGAAFRRLVNIETSATKMLAISQLEPSKGLREEPYIIHPTAIDASFQLILVAMAKGSGKNMQQLAIPLLMEEIDVCKSPAGADVSAIASASVNYKATMAELAVNGKPIFRVRGFKLSPLASDQPEGFDRHAAARLTWQEHFDFMDTSTLLKPPPAVEADARRALEEMTVLCILESEEHTRDIEPSLEHLARLKQWFQRTRLQLQGGQHPMLPASISSKLLVSLAEERASAITERSHEVLQSPCVASVGKAVLRIRDNMLRIFNREDEAIAILMEGGLLSELYSSISFDFSAFVKQLSISKPGLEILEVGGGTGGTTAAILDSIVEPGKHPPYARYVFTDVSAGFFPKAQERFCNTPNMEFLTLDITRNASDQGFKAGSYDLLIASNVIHAVPRLADALANIRPLLRPGGYLVLMELCGDSWSSGYVFGNFMGWWLGEHDEREWQPYVGIPRWDAELKAAGFTGVETSVLDCVKPFHSSAALVTRVPPLRCRQGLLDITLLHRRKDNQVPAKLASELTTKGHNVSLTEFGELPPPGAVVVATMDLESPFFENITEADLQRFQELCAKDQSKELLWLMPPTHVRCRNPRSSQSIGAIGVFRSENLLPFFSLEIACDEPEFTDLVLQVLGKISERDDYRRVTMDHEFAVDEGVVKVGRLEPLSLTEAGSVANDVLDDAPRQLEVANSGLLSTLQWKVTEASGPGEMEIEIDAKALGVNFQEVTVSGGLDAFVSGKYGFGIDVSGIVRNVGPKVSHVGVGDRVVGYCATGRLSTRPIINALNSIRIPHEMSFHDAVSIPSDFVAVVHSLLNVAQLEAGQTILIHSGCGGMGLAAQQVCRMVGAEAYITVGTDEEFDYAKNALHLPKDRIFSSRDKSFVDEIMRETTGIGVDVVLNLLSGPLLHASWKCVAEFGKMIDLTNMDISTFGKLDMEPFLMNRSYSCVQVGAMALRRPLEFQRLLQRVFGLVQEGKLRAPDKVFVFDAVDVESVFQHTKGGAFIGKTVVTIPDEPSSIPAELARLPIQKLDSSGTYLITGGLGGLGKSVATWMAEKGATSIVILSRSAGTRQRDLDFIAELESMGCTGIAVRGRVDCPQDLDAAIARAPSPIRGVIHFAMVQREGSAVTMNFEDWTAAIAPKVDGAWNLHNALLGQKLDFFVMSSSILTITNQPGESNYGAATSFLEAFCQYRRSLGLPASTLLICPMSEVGYMEDNPAAMRKVRSGGFTFSAEREFLDFMEYTVRPQKPDNSRTFGIWEGAGLSSPWSDDGYVAMGIRAEIPLSDPRCKMAWRRDPRFGTYHNLRADVASIKTQTANVAADLLARAKESPEVLDEAGTQELLATEIGLRIYSLMMNDEAEVDTSLTPQEVGVDSLMAVELRRWWKLTFGLDLQPLEIMGSGSFKELATLTITRLKLGLAAG